MRKSWLPKFGFRTSYPSSRTQRTRRRWELLPLQMYCVLKKYSFSTLLLLQRLSPTGIDPKVIEAAQKDFEALLSSVLKVKLTKKQAPPENDPSKNGMLGLLSEVFNIPKETETEMVQQSQFATSQKVF